ncbi:MAG TPA: methyltransferase domain-containing protein [Longimicrobium sp.]|nr:methyltransferase domain-containing protein [Longimicrobium sp.]
MLRSDDLSTLAASDPSLHLLRDRAPALFACIDPARVAEGRRVARRIAAAAHDFDSAARGGRGESYRRAQTATAVRSAGIRSLFDLLSPDRDFSSLPPDARILDVLGGDGLLARVVAQEAGGRWSGRILTSDVSPGMVRAAEAYGLPALCQAAQYLVLRDACMDGVILAYGTHHIPRPDRPVVCAEANRVLRAGGRVLLHDFEDGSPVARWFGEVVHAYSRTGHAFPHFTAAEMEDYLCSAGFVDVRVGPLYDPFVLEAPSEAEARSALAGYLADMYGLVVLVRDRGAEGARRHIGELADEYFRYDYAALGLPADFGVERTTLSRVAGGVRIELPRVALVGTGTRPPGSR